MADISKIKLPDGNEYNIKDTISGYIASETDPVFTASVAHGISASDITNWNGKQAALVSGTNIKTINNTSLLGSGNISVQSGLQNLVDGSATGSVKGIGTAAESSSYTIGQYALAEGYGTTASGYTSHAEGHSSTASGLMSHAEGYNTTASQNYTHAEGIGSAATYEASHAEGFSTTASGYTAHAEGANTIASGEASHAEGSLSQALAQYSHAGGRGTYANGTAQTAIGAFNTVADSYEDISPGNRAFIIGNGTDNNNRSDALTVDWSGNVNIASGAHYKINGTNLSASDVGAQPTLVSGTNIKTINNTSLLGSGNISIVNTREVPASSGTTLSLVNTGDMYSWNNKAQAKIVRWTESV